MNVRVRNRLVECGGLIGLLAVMSGCGQVSVFGHTVGETPATTPTPAVAAPNAAQPPSGQSTNAQASESQAGQMTLQKLQSVSVMLADEVTQKVTTDPRFSTEKLASVVKAELQSRGVIVSTDTNVTAVGKVVIDDYALRPTSNAALFGKVIYSGSLSGTLRIHDGQGDELSVRRIESKSQVSIPLKDQADDPMTPLYRRFAIDAGNLLAGTKKEPEESNFFRPR